MAETWPIDLVPYRVQFYLQANTTVFRSPVTRSAQRLMRQGQLWRCVASFREPRADHQRLSALLLKADGAYGSFRIWDFAHPLPLGDNLPHTGVGVTYFSSGSPVALTGFTSGSPAVVTGFYGGTAEPRVRGGWTAGATAILSERWLPNTTPLKAGDKFGIGDHLYELTDDAIADLQGVAELNFRPPLRVSVAHRAALVRTRPRVEMMLLDDDQPARSVDVNRVYDYTLSFVEVL